MFFKRSLVLLTGVLLFIGVYLLTQRISDARLDDKFKEQRVNYGVQGATLTAAQPSFAMPASATAPAPAPTPLPLSTSMSPDASSTPPPGAAPDANTLIGPAPPDMAAPGAPTPTPDNSAPAAAPSPTASSTPAPPASSDATSAPMTTPSPNSAAAPTTPAAADTSSGPMAPSPDASAPPMPSDSDSNSAPMTPGADTNSAPMPPPSTYFSPRTARWTALLLGATEAAPTPTNAVSPAAGSAAAPTMVAAPATNGVPATNSPAVSTGTNSAPGAPAFARAASASGRAIVLGYHQFCAAGTTSKNPYMMSQDVFISEMKYLHDNNYNVVPLSDVVKFIEHKGTLPPDAVAITIDDGYKSALNYAAPVLKQYGYPWTFFVYPSFITRTESKGAASWPDLVELDKEGVDVECHSMTHPQLSSHIQKHHTLSPEEYDAFLTTETSGAKAILEHELNKPIKYFAYPYGAYNKTVEDKAIAAGFEAIFTVADNPVHVTTNIYRVGRYIITKPVERLFASYLRQGALSLAQVDPEPGATISNPEPVITAVLGFNGDPATLETSVRDMGIVKHDFDPATSTVRIYLPRPLIDPEVLVSVRARDTQSGQTMVANWSFNYEPAGGAPAPVHPPIPDTSTSTTPAPATSAPTNAPAANPAPVSALTNSTASTKAGP